MTWLPLFVYNIALMVENKIFGWDLDYTLGNFLPIAANRRGITTTYDKELAHQSLRPGVIPFLERLCNQNCRNFILTQGSTAYALEVLATTGLTKYFEGIFEGKQINVGRGRRLGPLIKSVGLTAEEAQSQVLMIGDTRDDQPADISGIVFLFQPGGFKQDAAILDMISNRLDQEGEESFNRGFFSLYTRAHLVPDSPSSLRYYSINSAIKLLLEEQTTVYQAVTSNDRKVTTVPVLWPLNRP